MSENRSFWGPIFKYKCETCLQDSGWTTVAGKVEWRLKHMKETQHWYFCAFMKKIKEGENVTKLV